MSPLSASPQGTARVAVVGSTTLRGTRLRQMLAESGVPGSRVESVLGRRRSRSRSSASTTERRG